jgi:hypothetical protein
MALSKDLQALRTEMLADAKSPGETLGVHMMFECLSQGLTGQADMAKMSTEARGWLKANLSVRAADSAEKVDELWEQMQKRNAADAAFTELKAVK